MTSSTGSISVSGLLGGTAGQIDVTSLINQLMQAQSVPQNQLKDQLTTVQTQVAAYQAINTKLTALQTAAQALTAPATWSATAAMSSNAAVVATSTDAAAVGATTFDVVQLAAAQVTTVAADAQGNVVADPSAGITITGADGTAHTVAIASGSAADVAKAVNAAGVGVRASVVTTDQGVVLQLSSAKTGTANAFTAAGFQSTAQTLVSAQDAKVSVGGSSGYTVSSSSNTFTGLIPGVTFSVSAPATNVTISVASDEQSISDKVQAVVTAANTAMAELQADSGQGAVLQGRFDVRTLASALMSAVSQGTATGGSLADYGIDLDTSGKFSFDADKFAAAYGADPTGTQSAVSGAFATRLADATTGAVDPTTGSITQALSGLSDQTTRLNDEIDQWTTRLADIQSSLQAKYTAMETALARLQSQQTYLTSMFNSINNSNSDSSSS
jgi:flagellar hook-associated protein 2